MNSFSQLVLSWMFGRWMFDTSNVTSFVAQDVTPLTIFASAFATLGLAMFGALAAWAMFLGIFRLKNNGNFFGAKDGNEAFFYPLRVILALTLVAPVIPVSSAGGIPITLTPGHALVAGVSKSAAEFGDTMQHDAFELMHRHNLFSDPKFRVEVDAKVALDMLNSWKVSAVQLAALKIFRDPNAQLTSLSSRDVAGEAIKIKWNQVYGVKYPAVGSTDTAAGVYIANAGRSLQIPLIPPSDELARAVSMGFRD
ncbi:hypothetical protein [Pseudomonas bharatica]|uniref:hypothetical protein n=1 Tax=Pseudomonas bharatica TaxID=2692112 RepID=UPI001F043B62|nr:hypothetical protein [Pseudomonas bharatica]